MTCDKDNDCSIQVAFLHSSIHPQQYGNCLHKNVQLYFTSAITVFISDVELKKINLPLFDGNPLAANERKTCYFAQDMHITYMNCPCNLQKPAIYTVQGQKIHIDTAA